jgi:hypothetical protein
LTEEIGYKMELNEFIQKRDFLYHLTDKENLTYIKEHKKLLSTESIVSLTSLSETEKEEFLSNRRKTHTEIKVGKSKYMIRDQRPISLVNLVKCLTTGFSVKDFFRTLNNRVFFWPTINRLRSHYNRYSNENPIIIKVPSEEIFKINNHAEFCRLNSGATRSNSYLNGAPPQRGKGTFVLAEFFKYPVGKVAEVTFSEECKLPGSIFVGNSPDGPWEKIIL